MNHPSDHNRDALNDWLDALATGSTPPSTAPDADLTSIQSAATWFQKKVSNGERHALAISAGAHSWEAIMQSHTAPIAAPSAPEAHPVPAFGRRLGRSIGRWQAAVSLAVVVAVLAALMGIAWQRGILDNPPPTEPGNLAALGQQSTPIPDSYCVPRTTPRMTSAELETMTLSDWPIRHYTGIGPASLEQGQAVLDAFIGWQQCQAIWIWNEAEPNKYASSEMLGFYSDRLQYIVLAPTFADPREDDVALYTTDQSTIDQIVLGAPLPINVPHDPDATFPSTPGFIQQGFRPGDVFRLSDGRFGVIMGSIQMADLLLNPAPSNPQMLRFYAFTEVDGLMYLDETQILCTSDIQDTLTHEGIPPDGIGVCEDFQG